MTRRRLSVVLAVLVLLVSGVRRRFLLSDSAHRSRDGHTGSDSHKY